MDHNSTDEDPIREQRNEQLQDRNQLEGNNININNKGRFKNLKTKKNVLKLQSRHNFCYFKLV